MYRHRRHTDEDDLLDIIMWSVMGMMVLVGVIFMTVNIKQANACVDSGGEVLNTVCVKKGTILSHSN